MCTGEAVHWCPTCTIAAPIVVHLLSQPWHHTVVSIPPQGCLGAVACDHTSVPEVSEKNNKSVTKLK